MAAAPALLAVDWGSSALRGTLLAADGTVLAEHAAPRGLLQVRSGGWAQVFDDEFGPWLVAHPGLLCLMSGMVGSRQGWAEAAYCACPASLDDLAKQLLWLRPGQLAIVPGLSCAPDGQPDVMRGEETQAFGALRLLGLDQATLVLPGTHSKWVQVAGGRITGFATHMTGECFALLRQHSILARTLPADNHDAAAAWVPEAFDDGVTRAQQPGGLLHHVFSVRSLALFDRRDGPWLLSYLSGLVIGEELRSQGLPAGALAGLSLLLVGSAALTQRYHRALALLGHSSTCVGAEATWAGLAALAARLPT